MFFFLRKKHHLIKCGELSRPAQHFGCFLSPATSVTSAPENISLEWLILRMNNGNCYRACREILVIQASPPKPKHAHTRTPLSFNPSIHPHLLAWRRQWEWARLKCRYESVAQSSEIDAAFRCLYTFPIPGCSPALGAQLHIPSEMLSNAILPPPRLWSICWCCGIFKIWGGAGGRWISLGVIAKAEAYPFLSAVTPQKNKTHVCASTACWITTSTKTTSKPISEADVCSCFCKLFWGGEGVKRGTPQTKEPDAGWKKKS